jgi:hypothetical protein
MAQAVSWLHLNDFTGFMLDGLGFKEVLPEWSRGMALRSVLRWAPDLLPRFESMGNLA